MVKEIVHDSMFLGQKSVDATKEDKQVAEDLLDTLRANLGHCVGMAANMIGVKKNIIAISVGLGQFINRQKKRLCFLSEMRRKLDGLKPLQFSRERRKKPPSVNRDTIKQLTTMSTR